MEFMRPGGPGAGFCPQSEVARGKSDHPGEHQHPDERADVHGTQLLVKINANIGNSAVGQLHRGKVEKLQWATVGPPTR